MVATGTPIVRLEKDETVHLSYCTNIHAGDDWEKVFPQLQREVPKVKKTVSPDKPFGIGLRVSKLSATQLVGETLQTFLDWMKAEDIYVYTINGFPYGPFHGTTVKQDVYKPDWADSARLEYTQELINLCAKLNPPDNYATISTVPGTYKDWADGRMPDIVENLLQCVAHSMKVERDTGVRVALSLEPEPACLLETSEEAIAFFKEYLHCETGINRLMAIASCSENEANAALHSLIGLCFDVCHSAVEFEEPNSTIEKIQAANIAIIKVQLSSALQIKEVNDESLKHLATFNEPVYLHQVVERSGGKLTRFTDLGEAFTYRETNSGDKAADTQWRVHFHVPVFMQDMPKFSTTQDVLTQVLEIQKRQGISNHLEVETYTWDVLPDDVRNVSVDEAIARELNWVTERL